MRYCEGKLMEFTDEELESCYRFAKGMRGNHNRAMIMERKDWEIFRDDFRGKLGEVAVRNCIVADFPDAKIERDIDFEVTPLGKWDTVDLQVNGMNINVKSVKQKSGFLMVETKRYNDDGTYAYKNNDGTEVKVDAYILVRVTVEPDMGEGTMNYTDVGQLKRNHRTVSAQILGGILHSEFWGNKHFAPNGIKCTYKNLLAICNGKSELPDKIKGGEKKTKKLQQDNYFLCEKELHPIDNILKGTQE